MIKTMKPLTLAEVQHLGKTLDINEEEMKKYLKNFGNLTADKAKVMIEALKSLQNAKLNEEYIVKIVDFLPKDAEDLNKIVIDVALDQEEINEILSIVQGK